MGVAKKYSDPENCANLGEPDPEPCDTVDTASCGARRTDVGDGGDVVLGKLLLVVAVLEFALF